MKLMWTFTYGKKLLFMENIKICDSFRANSLMRNFFAVDLKTSCYGLTRHTKMTGKT